AGALSSGCRALANRSSSCSATAAKSQRPPRLSKPAAAGGVAPRIPRPTASTRTGSESGASAATITASSSDPNTVQALPDPHAPGLGGAPLPPVPSTPLGVPGGAAHRTLGDGEDGEN